MTFIHQDFSHLGKCGCQLPSHSVNYNPETFKAKGVTFNFGKVLDKEVTCMLRHTGRTLWPKNKFTLHLFPMHLVGPVA